MYVYVYVCVCVYVCVYVCVCIYIYIYIYVHLSVSLYFFSAPKRLKAPCGGMSTQGKAMIARIQRGELPPGLKSWPSEKVGCAPNLIEL